MTAGNRREVMLVSSSDDLISIVGLSREVGGAAKATLRMFKGLQTTDIRKRYKFYCIEGKRSNTDGFLSLPWKGKMRIAEMVGLGVYKRKILDLGLRLWAAMIVSSHSRHEFFYSKNLVDGESIERDASVIHYVWVQLIGRSFLRKHKKPYIVTLHDMWQLTGGCAYTFECNEFYNQCSYCPEVKKYAQRRLRRNKLEKLEFLNKAYCVVVTSEWMRGEAIRAGVKPESLVRIENYIPETFRYTRGVRSSSEMITNGHRDRYKRRIYFVGSTQDPRKGFSYLIKALVECANIDWERWELSVLGSKDEDLDWVRTLGISTKGYGFLQDDHSQMQMYNKVELLVCPSLEDNSPNVIAEAHCCGLPTIVMGGTGAAEMVEESIDGWIAKERTVLGLRATIEQALNEIDRIDKELIAKRARCRYGKERTLLAYSRIYKDASKANG